MRTVFEQVEEFNREVLSIAKRSHGAAPESEIDLSKIQLNEEIGEFLDAWKENDVGEMADAMVDLIYFACGVAYKQGVGHEAMSELFNRVHDANMKKAAGKKEGRGYDGDAVDAAKPKDWVAPDADKIIKRYDFEQVEVLVIKDIGDFTAGEILHCARYYDDGRYMMLTDYNIYINEDVHVWQPDDFLGHYVLNDSDYFRINNDSEHFRL